MVRKVGGGGSDMKKKSQISIIAHGNKYSQICSYLFCSKFSENLRRSALKIKKNWSHQWGSENSNIKI